MIKPTVQLSERDGNVFSIIARVMRALKEAGQKDRAEKFREKAMKSKSYDDVLQLCFKYVDVE